uniref:Vacuolar iron transporter n=1 Tax=Oryza glumipatula TaxID=40148 RepID=A0A0E0BFN7_9ORYZ
MAATNGDAELTVAEEAKEEEATDDGGGGVSSQWLRAAVLGASDGLVSTAALMLGIGAARPADARAVLLVRVVVVVATASLALAAFGAAGARLGRAPGGQAGLRAVVGGLLAMAATYGVMKLFRTHGV